MPQPVAARTDKNALYLVDSSIYVFRAWHTVGPITDTEGKSANAAHGFIDFLYQLITRRRPRLLVCAFDESHGQSDRHKIYPAYKANRPPAPADLKHQFALCKLFVKSCGITALASPDIEADDIIGCLASQAQAADISSVIISADKDLCQFVGRNDAVWDYAKDTWLDARLIEKRFGVRPNQIPDLLALTGDKVDNIPGVPGVGITTAAKLLIKWGNLDVLFNNVHKVATMKFRGASHVAALLEEHRDTVRLARKLTGLHSRPDFTMDVTTLNINPDHGELEKACRQIGLPEAQQSRWQNLLDG